MIKLLYCKITAGAVTKLKEMCSKELDKLSHEELNKILLEMKAEEEIEADENLQY